MGRPHPAVLAFLGACACAHLSPVIVSRDPLSAAEHMRLGAAYEAQGLPADAAQQYDTAAKMDPADAEAWIALGNLAFARGDYPVAESDFKRALMISPMHAGAENNLAMTYLAENERLDEAERLAKSALSRSRGGPMRPYILDTLSKIREHEGRADAGSAAQPPAL